MHPKSFYKIGEIASALNVKTSLLRFWEKEFAQFIKPQRNNRGVRLYQQKDFEMFRKIYHYLKVEKLTIQGAKAKLHQEKTLPEEREQILQSLYTLRQLLLDLKSILENKR